jgi:hypothetical protein
MPDGSIPDPRMNPKEKQYGIIKVNGVYCAYDKIKKVDPKRFMPYGFTVKEDWIKKVKPLNQTILWNGHIIDIEVDIDLPDKYSEHYDPEVDNDQEPVAAHLYKWAWENLESIMGGNSELNTTP